MCTDITLKGILLPILVCKHHLQKNTWHLLNTILPQTQCFLFMWGGELFKRRRAELAVSKIRVQMLKMYDMSLQ